MGLPAYRNVLVLPLVLLATLMPRSQAAECCSVGKFGVAVNSCISRRPVEACDPSLTWDSSIKLRNISSGQVLATWKAPATGDISRYNVTVNATGERMTNEVSREWTLLTDLEPSQTTYELQVCITGCCCVEFFTPGQIQSPPVTGIKVSQFNPLLDNSVLSAQVLWNPAINSVSMYQVRIYHVDENLQELSSISPLAVSANVTHVTVSGRSDRGELLYPLQANSTYLVEVGVVMTMGSSDVMQSNPVLFTANSSNPLREVFLVTRNNDGQGFGQLVGSLNADQSELLGPIALDVKKRRVFHYDEMKCIRNCSYNLHHCQVLRGSCVTVVDFVPKSIAYDWIADEIYTMAEIGSDLHLIKYSKHMASGTSYTNVYSTKKPSSNIIQIQMTMNPFNGVVHWTTELADLDVQSATLNKLDLKSAPPLTHHDRLSNGITGALASMVRHGCLLLVKVDGTLISLEEDSVSITNQDCGGGAFSIANEIQQIQPPSMPAKIPAVGFDEYGLYYVSSDDMDTVQFEPYTGFGGTPSELSYTNDPSDSGQRTMSVSLTGTSAGLQPLPANPSCLSLDYGNFSNRLVPTFQRVSSTVLLISWVDNAPLHTNCVGEVYSRPPTQYKVYVSNNSGPLEGYNPLVQYDTSLRLINISLSTSYSVSVEARNSFTVLNNSGISDLRGPVVIYKPESEISTTVSPSPSITPSVIPKPNDNIGIAVMAIAGVSAGVALTGIVIVVIVITTACLYTRRKKNTAEGSHKHTNTPASPLYASPIYQEPDNILPSGRSHVLQHISHSAGNLQGFHTLPVGTNQDLGQYEEIGMPTMKRCFTDPTILSTHVMNDSPNLNPKPYEVPSRSATPRLNSLLDRSSTPHNELITSFCISQELVSMGSEVSIPIQPYEVPEPTGSSPINPHSNASSPQTPPPPPPPPYSSVIPSDKRKNQVPSTSNQSSQSSSISLNIEDEASSCHRVPDQANTSSTPSDTYSRLKRSDYNDQTSSVLDSENTAYPPTLYSTLSSREN